ncbi:MAG: phosphate signaling complex protein PhoU [Roseiflexaceae bacterium]
MAVRTRYQHDLRDLQQQVLFLAEAVDRALVDALWALSQRSVGTAQQIVREDSQIDAQRVAIEEHALRLLACQQPLLGEDLRLVSAAVAIAAELERMGDHARGIATLVIRSANLAGNAPLPRIEAMAYTVRSMLQQAVRAVLNRDTAVISQLRQMDNTVDQTYAQLFQEMLAQMRIHPEASEWSTYVLWIAHNLERIADRSIAIAGRAAFIATGAMPWVLPEPGGLGRGLGPEQPAG